MQDVKSIVAENLTILRKRKGITQAELAEKFNYSDKAVCRWEHGDTLPDINVLYAICEFYDITMNDLVDPDFSYREFEKPIKESTSYRIWLCVLLSSAIWLIATVWFVSSMTIYHNPYWLAFVWAVPACCLAVAKTLKHQLGWIGKVITYSLFSWTVITSVYLHFFLRFGQHIWPLFLVGIPLQAFVVIWQKFKSYRDGI